MWHSAILLLHRAAVIVFGITPGSIALPAMIVPGPEGKNLASGRQHLVCRPDPARRTSDSSSSAPEKARLHANLLALRPAVCRRHPGGTPGKVASKAPQNLDVKLKN
jgi:hypothetical protein